MLMYYLGLIRVPICSVCFLSSYIYLGFHSFGCLDLVISFVIMRTEYGSI